MSLPGGDLVGTQVEGPPSHGEGESDSESVGEEDLQEKFASQVGGAPLDMGPNVDEESDDQEDAPLIAIASTVPPVAAPREGEKEIGGADQYGPISDWVVSPCQRLPIKALRWDRNSEHGQAREYNFLHTRHILESMKLGGSLRNPIRILTVEAGGTLSPSCMHVFSITPVQTVPTRSLGVSTVLLQ